MLTISKPLGASQAQRYHREEFANAQENYYSEGERIRGEWHGRLAERFGLQGEVQEQHFARLAEGQHPLTGAQLVKHQVAREYKGASGELVKSMEHRAGWDATFSAPKTVSLTALVGGHEGARRAHRESVDVALGELERFVDARIGGNHPAVRTGVLVAAKFEHDSARPVDGYAAPQLHTHVVVFNLTELPDGKAKALQTRELFKAQQYVTAVYRSELALRLRREGFELLRGEHGQPEIKGYSAEYVKASSPRSQEIREQMAQEGVKGARAAQIAAHQTRGEKLELSHEEVQRQHRELAAQHGHQPVRVIQEARARGAVELEQGARERVAESALRYAQGRNLERTAVAGERELLRDALKRSLGEASLKDVNEGLERRVAQGELREALGQGGVRAFTTDAMLQLERENLERMRAGRGGFDELAREETRRAVLVEHGHLSAGQRAAVEQVLKNRDRVMALEGVAGGGKTTSLAAIRQAVEREGRVVLGFAPTSRAARKLGESGIPASTLQRHLVRRAHHGPEPRLYVVDESSLASTKQMHTFLARLHERDRVLLVGDVRQHQAVEAGRPYQQMQDGGMQVARLDEIVRQKDARLREVVEQLSRGQVGPAVKSLERQGRVHEVKERGERLMAIAREYVREPAGTLVVSPDNRSRQEINLLVHGERQRLGQVDAREHSLRLLESRADLTGPDRAWAGQYQRGQVVRYSKGSRELGLGPGEYAKVERVESKRNRVTVTRADGERVTYDPRRLQGVTLYREAERKLARGERVQFTAPSERLGVANRELGQVEALAANGDLRIKLDSGRTLAFNVREHPHLDYGYAVTSHSGQGETAERVLLHVETDRGELLVNSRLAYVAVSRGRHDAQVFTNDAAGLARALGREVSQASALEGLAQAVPSSAAKAVAPTPQQAVAQVVIGTVIDKLKGATIDAAVQIARSPEGDHGQGHGM
jgi:conjugative relaxase-like TrwC/TraI family protein